MDKKLEEIKKQLHKEIEDIQSWDDFYINIRWSVEDIKYHAEDSEINPTTKEAVEILKDLQDWHDAETGVNWDTIDIELTKLEESRETDKAEDGTPSEVIEGEYIMTENN